MEVEEDTGETSCFSSSSSSSSSCSGSEEEEEEEKMSLKPPDPCLLCGQPAVYYDCEGNVIKREVAGAATSHHRTQGGGGEDSYLSCIYKCFRVPTRNQRLEEEGNLEGVMGGGINLPLPICVSCEELVVMLLEMYERVEELENVLRRKAREAEQKFVEEELYRKYDDGQGNHAGLRGVLLGVHQGTTRKKERKTTTTTSSSEATNEPEQRGPNTGVVVTNILFCEPTTLDDSLIQNEEEEEDEECGLEDLPQPPRTIIGNEEEAPPAPPLVEETVVIDDGRNNSPIAVVSEPSSSSGGRQRSSRNRQVRRNYDESSSSEEHDIKDSDTAEHDMLDAVEESSSSESPDEDRNSADFFEVEEPDRGRRNKMAYLASRTTGPKENTAGGKGRRFHRVAQQRHNNKKIIIKKKQRRKTRSQPNPTENPICNKIDDPETRRAFLTKVVEHQKSYDYNNIKEKIVIRRGRGRPRNPNPTLVRRNDKTCKFDPTTGNISYTYSHNARQSSSTSSGAPPSASPSSKVTLEFVKQAADSSYKCSSCSRPVSVFKGDARSMSIDRTALLSHARSFHHPQGNCGTCPVCQMPVPSFFSKDYYNHRLTHLNEEERVAALANPVWRKLGGVSKAPRFPPMESRRIISPELASLHHDINQCPTCGKFIANGLPALQRHERSHLGSLAEKKSHLCADCGASFTTKYVLDIHIIKKHHSNNATVRNNKCHICKTVRYFKSERSLEAHMRKGLHDDGRRRRKSSRSGGDNSSEVKQLPFQCTHAHDEDDDDDNQCGKSFATGAALKQHVTMVHVNANNTSSNPVPWTCPMPFCKDTKREFRSKQERLEHYIQAHPKSKIAIDARGPNESVGCEYPSCGKGFPDEASLQSHVSLEHAPSASALAQFMCPLCGKVVSQDWVLKQHHLIHTGERKHVCKECNSSFPIRSSLLSHLAAKHGQGPLSGTFQCEQPGCDKLYQSRVSFKTHLRAVHKIFDGRSRRSNQTSGNKTS